MNYPYTIPDTATLYKEGMYVDYFTVSGITFTVLYAEYGWALYNINRVNEEGYVYSYTIHLGINDSINNYDCKPIEEGMEISGNGNDEEVE